MRVVLHERVDGLGQRGDIVEVADGHARNMLIPKGLAQQASPGVEAQAAAMKKAWEVSNARQRKAAEDIAKVLVATTVEIPMRSGGDGRLFGSVTAADVAEAIHNQVDIDLDRKTVHLDEPIRSLGTHVVTVKAHPEVEFPVSVSVVPAD
ncbi:MAG: 50S ribosomal protein L9 [Acidimicrobiales bacterium]